jgi:hypothetical protein
MSAGSVLVSVQKRPGTSAVTRARPPPQAPNWKLVSPEVAERALTSSPVGAAVQVETEWGQAGAEVEARAAEASGSGVVEGAWAEPAAGASVAAEVGPEAKAGGEAVGEEAAVVAAAGAAAGSPRPP